MSEQSPYGNYPTTPNNAAPQQSLYTQNGYQGYQQNGSYNSPQNAMQGYNPVGNGQSRPRPKVGFGTAIRNSFKYIFHFSGRASRTEYWWVFLLWAILFTVVGLGMFVALLVGAGASSSTAEDVGFSIFFVLYLSLFLLGLLQTVHMLALTWRRLQDAGYPGALSILMFVGIGIVPFVMSFFPSSPDGYQYDRPADYNRP